MRTECEGSGIIASNSRESQGRTTNFCKSSVIFWGHHKNLIHTENRGNYFLVLGKGTSKIAEIQGKPEAIVKAKPTKENIKFYMFTLDLF